ncbi:MAG: membrane protein insertase YidC [Elusimicrobia bacterium]|nr:membrane protein insertase YidC [Elusimicrobiota bacterium]MDD7578986.1 membrane protein insertase YidC [Elusimicrobiota bacterium]MDY6040190.1 membrane protein insertase YidC [Elusimicrobiaceae bacterium]
MNRQFLVTAMLFLLVITGYNQFVALPRARAAQEAAEAQLKKSAEEAAKESASAALLVSSSSASIIAKEAPQPKPEELFTLNLPHADVTFSSKGAGIKKYLFKDIVSDVDLTPYEGRGYFATLPQVDFTEFARTKDSITFTGDIVSGLTVSKTYRFNENGINNLSVTFENRTSHPFTLGEWDYNFGPGLATVKSEMKDNERESKAVYLVQEEGKRKPTLETFTKKSKQPELPWMWAGVENRYFLAVLIPQGWKPGALAADKPVIGKQDGMLWGLFGQNDLTGPKLTVSVPPAVLEAKSKLEYNSDFYFGPKDYKQFLDLPYHLDRSIAFGFFGALGKIARNVLETFYGWTGNYGVAIIMMTVLLQVILFKFTLMQLKSAAQMKKIQPEMKRIQEKYKGDAQAMNRATLELYQKNKVNPLAGCLPMLIQLPIFLALFNALRTSWALHGAKFVFWLTDLSSKDPYYILPILMGAVMFFQQKGNIPAGTDPSQAAMFKYMPLIFTLLFMNFPSGLVLYWLTNSLLMYAIQTFINRKMAKAN